MWFVQGPGHGVEYHHVGPEHLHVFPFDRRLPQYVDVAYLFKQQLHTAPEVWVIPLHEDSDVGHDRIQQVGFRIKGLAPHRGQHLGVATRVVSTRGSGLQQRVGPGMWPETVGASRYVLTPGVLRTMSGSGYMAWRLTPPLVCGEG